MITKHDLAALMAMPDQPQQFHFCAWCKQYFDSAWREMPEPVEKPELLSHGICPECKRREMESWKRKAL